MWQLCKTQIFKGKTYELLLFLRSDAAATIYLLLIIVQLLFVGSLLLEGGGLLFRKPAEIIDGWIKYVWAIQWQLLNTVTSTHSFSVLLSTLEMSYTIQTAPVLARWPIRIRIHVLRILAATTIRGQCLYIVLRASNCVATIQGHCLIEEIWYA